MINASNTNLFNRYSNLACNSYYGIPIEPENLFEQGHEQDHCEAFIRTHFEKGCKGEALNFRETWEKRYKAEGKHVHAVSLYIMGLCFKDIICKKLKTKMKEILGDEVTSWYEFRYTWFLTCLFHDAASCIEMGWEEGNQGDLQSAIKSNYFSAVSSVCDGVSFEQFAECYSKRQFTENDYLALTKDTEFVRECDSRLLAKIYAITAHSFYQLSKFGEEMPSFSDCLIPEEGKVLPIEEQSSTDEEFTETLKNCITKEEWKWFAPLAKTNIEVFEEEKKQPKRAVKAPKATLTKWKSAEQQCADIEKIMGNNASCVGNQNLGYDVVSKTPNGETRYIEVKLLSSDSGTFSLTSNEYATAHQLGESFILCLMVQSETGIAVTYIRNPIETVQLEKRVKQWEWFCSGFDGERQFYPY